MSQTAFRLLAERPVLCLLHERSGRLRARGSRVPRAAFPQESLTFAGDVRGHVEAAVVVRPAGTRRPWPVLPLMLLLFTKK